MEFRLTYRGPLKTKNATSRADTQQMRRQFHSQLKHLWNSAVLADARPFVDPTREVKEGEICLLQRIGPFVFAPIVSQAHGWNAVATIDLLFMRPSDPGQLINHGGDLDNRLKTLFDALRVPSLSELPSDAQLGSDENPYYCLLQDDALVTGFGVTTDRLLAPASAHDVELIIRVNARATRKSWKNDCLW